ncbi:hypothetical protein FIBSPDRAFT_878830 [Athelia psychrophila]|uniref:Uncharacterized protein n=1 Tax=Athelia psychrophila TaxID=1759441 RepID=A0A167UP21_9AGAM|nr:hypothetical protein FIBSPDRAFT_878830 [Fibularhizoctonia sp. CBS 109695]
MNGMDIEPPISALPGASFGRLSEDEEEVLTSEEECAITIFDEDDDRPGEHSCTLCRLRFEDGLADTPETYINPSMDVLIAHCKEEHPTVWDSLRHTRPSESPPESPVPS